MFYITGGKSGLEQIEHYRKNYEWVYENIIVDISILSASCYSRAV